MAIGLSAALLASSVTWASLSPLHIRYQPCTTCPHTVACRFEQLSCFVPLPKPGLLGSLGAVSNSSAHGGSNGDASKGTPADKAASNSGNSGKGGENGHHGSGQEAVPGMREVLRSVSGVARCGELVGVLGPSGSGKTTLLALLTGSTEDIGRGAHVSGEVLVDGSRIHGAERRKVQTMPCLLPCLLALFACQPSPSLAFQLAGRPACLFVCLSTSGFGGRDFRAYCSLPRWF